jgi:hypothetical protein
MNSYQASDRRELLHRITPVGWFLIVLGVALVGVLGFGGLQRLRDRLPAEAPAPAATATPTSAPTLEPTATAVVTETAAFPAYWSEGMHQDATGHWWPAEDMREEVQALVEQHYLEQEKVMGQNQLAILDTVTDESIRDYWTGPFLENFYTTKGRYLETGEFNQVAQIVDERVIIVQGFSEDGKMVQVGDTYMAAHLEQYNEETDTWDRIEIPEDGYLDGTQYLGVAILNMQYDEEDGRWKVHSFEKWIPRP